MRAHHLLCFALAGCGTPSSGGDMGVPPDLMTFGSDDLSGPKKDLSGPCGADKPSSIPDGGVCVVTVSGTLVDTMAKPVVGILPTVCAGVCYFGSKTDASGNFNVAIDHYILTDLFALEVHGRPDYVNYYARVPKVAGTTASYASPLPVPLLPTMGPLIALDKSAQVLTSGDVTLTIDQGTDVQQDPEDVALGDQGRMLRVYTAPDPSKLPFVDGASPPDALYGFAPFEVIFSQPVHLAFANTAKYPAGTQFDVLSQGGLLSSPPPAGNFAKVATATVTMDGSKIAMDAGTGVTTLTWIALKKR